MSALPEAVLWRRDINGRASLHSWLGSSDRASRSSTVGHELLIRYFSCLQLRSVAGLFHFRSKDVYAPKENLFFHLWERDYRRVYWKDNRPGKLDFSGGVVGPSVHHCRMRLRQGTLRLSTQGNLPERARNPPIDARSRLRIPEVGRRRSAAFTACWTAACPATAEHGRCQVGHLDLT